MSLKHLRSRDGQEVWLNFRGINYFADIFLNGKRVNTNTHQGMYLREKYLITPYLNKGKPNKLAVWVAPPDPVGNAYAGQGGDGTIGRNVTMQCHGRMGLDLSDTRQKYRYLGPGFY